MRSLLDVNALIALFQPNHIHHQSAHRWLESTQDYGWASCPLTENGFVRIISQLRYEARISIQEAANKLEIFAAGTNHDFWPDDVSLLDKERFNRNRVLGPKQLTDVYLLGLAVKHGGRLATFDGSISLHAVRDAEPRHLVSIPRA